MTDADTLLRMVRKTAMAITVPKGSIVNGGTKDLLVPVTGI